MSTAMDALEALVWQQLHTVRDLSEQITAIRVREASADGAVIAEVDGNGTLQDLTLSEAILTMSTNEFESAVVTTARRAAHLAIARRGALVTTYLHALTHSESSLDVPADRQGPADQRPTAVMPDQDRKWL
ncbi:YbaB/EbfC family nucleoid-associated protein [Nocardia flavorosea]|uniref:YbaB/EbfC family nucleoid-associated protein n=2 Tax=Nocardia flavorosea TaxID=53429 RepID=A0A846YN53_9NOCA|nr:YbaB/EbfC family nucleoid-associated protein [Nocardia flavorosea]